MPVSDVDDDDNGRPDYFGLRARVSLNAASRASAVLTGLTNAYSSYLDGVGESVVAISAGLSQAPNTTDCARALVAEDGADITAACGRPLKSFDPEAEAKFAEAAEAARRAADAFYYGVEALLDVGDPTLGATPGADGYAAGLGLAVGRRSGEGVDAPQFQLRGGVFYTNREEDRRFGASAAAGFEFSRPQGVQEISFGVGLEGRYVQDAADDAVAEIDESYLRVRGSVNVPLGPAYSAAVAFGTGTDGPVLSGNWQLLLPGR